MFQSVAGIRWLVPEPTIGSLRKAGWGKYVGLRIQPKQPPGGAWFEGSPLLTNQERNSPMNESTPTHTHTDPRRADHSDHARPQRGWPFGGTHRSRSGENVRMDQGRFGQRVNHAGPSRCDFHRLEHAAGPASPRYP